MDTGGRGLGFGRDRRVTAEENEELIALTGQLMLILSS